MQLVVPWTASLKHSQTCLVFMVLRMKPYMMLYTQATTPASVAVVAPERMPPMMMTGMMSAGSALRVS